MTLALILFGLFTVLASAGLYWILREHWGLRAARGGVVVVLVGFGLLAAFVAWLLLSGLASPPG